MPPSALPHGLDVLAALIPMWVWATLWGVWFPVCMVAAFRTRRGTERNRADVLAWSGLVGMLTAWSLGYLGGWVLYVIGTVNLPGSGRAYIAGSLYLCVALIAGATARMRNPRDVVHRIEVVDR